MSRRCMTNFIGGHYRKTLAVAVLGALLCASDGHAADGQWKARTQVFFDSERETLVRKRVRVWDPRPDHDLEFLWEQANYDPATAPETISGTGKLTWRTKGAAEYDRRAVQSVYEGQMRDGKSHGKGSLVTNAGVYYSGTWKNGAMDGQGTIKFTNGDEYEGNFAAGLMHGNGRYAAADGTVFEGQYRKGLRHGTGVLTLISGQSVKTTWRDGQEIARVAVDNGASRSSKMSREELQLVQNVDGLLLRILSDAKANEKFVKAEEEGAGYDSHVYEAQIAADVITVNLKSKEIVSAWKGNATIPEGFSQFEDVVQFAPVFLVADIQNSGAQSKQISRAYLEVKESSTDKQPYLTISGAKMKTSCNSLTGYDPEFYFFNYGWGAVRNARLVYTFGTKVSRTGEFETALGNFDEDKETSVENGLRAARVDVQTLGSGKLKCASASKVPSCLKQIEAKGTLGQLAGRVSTQEGLVFTNVAGRIDYEWTASDGTIRKRSSPFDMDVPLALLVGGAECGAAGPVERNPKTLQLSLDRRDYRIPLNWQAQLAGQQNKRFGFALVAAKSSSHTFKVILELADGSRIASPRIELSYFLPRFSAVSEN